MRPVPARRRPCRAARGCILAAVFLCGHVEAACVDLHHKEGPIGCWDGATGTPELCPPGRTHPLWTKSAMQAALRNFSHLYALRPICVNNWGVNANHAFALWFTVKMLKPRVVIHSGLLFGQSTWLIRMALGPVPRMYALDPRHELNLHYIDRGRTTYMMGDHFQDFGEVDWGRLLSPKERARTLVVLDDHQSVTRRIREVLAHGFSHVFWDDNPNEFYSSGFYIDMYSYNAVCSPLPPGLSNLAYRDQFGRESMNITVEAHQENVEYIRAKTDTYFEFPPVFDGCSRTSGDGAAGPLLGNATRLLAFGLPPVARDPAHYDHMYPAYAKLRA